jgi:hypothetical protein
MGLSILTTIILFLICLVGGIAIGLLLGRYLRPTAEMPSEEIHTSKIPFVKEKEPAKPVDPALLRVGRTKKKALWLEMYGQRWEKGNELPPEDRRELNAIVQDLGAWLETSPSPVPNPEAYDPKPAKNSPFTRSFSPGRSPKKSSPLPGKGDATVNPVSMVVQIDAILQQKLVGTPFSNIDIHILESLTGEVNVQVGAMKHLSVDSIPNHEIQALIRESVAEWEKLTQ